jgi:hypothetical protein
LRKPTNDGSVTPSESPLYKSSVLLTLDGSSLCSGFMIDAKTALTVSHCFRKLATVKKSGARLKLFIAGRQVTDEFKVFADPSFDFSEDRASASSNDIAAIIFNRPVAKAPFIQVIMDPKVPLSVTDVFSTIGYGASPLEKKDSIFLGVARITRLKQLDLTQDDLLTMSSGPAGSGMICGNDSGSPLFMEREKRFFLVGVLSGGRSEATEAEVAWQNSLTEAQRNLPANIVRQCRSEVGESYWTRTQAYADFLANPAKLGKLILQGN